LAYLYVEQNVLEKVSIDYDWNIFLEANYDFIGESSITHAYSNNPDLYDTYGSHPSTLNEHNTIIHQLWWDDETMKTQLGLLLNIDVVSISSTKQPCGHFNPLHIDGFHKINRKYPTDGRKKVRANIFLEDWKFGHILQYEFKGAWSCPTHWKQGEGFIWDSSVPHLSGNSGFQSKFTLQVSGFYNG